MAIEKEKKFDLVGNLIDVQLHGVEGFNEVEKEFLLNALNLKRKIDNSQNYRLALLSTPMTQKGGKTNAEIYTFWRSGYSNFDKAIDNDLDYFITMFYKDNGTLGYTSMSTARMFINRKFYLSWIQMKGNLGLAGLIGNLNHEYMHSMGFTHKGIGSYKRNSVPYVYGREASNLARKYLQGKVNLTPLIEYSHE